MTKFSDQTSSYFDDDNAEQSLLENSVVDEMDNEIVITEAMIQLACASLDHDSELALSTNPEAFK